MKAMILAAGKGTRVRPITYTIPKPMIPIMQKPVMEFCWSCYDSMALIRSW
jgi:mannose-1-phosphate guanylyltransferase